MAHYTIQCDPALPALSARVPGKLAARFTFINCVLAELRHLGLSFGTISRHDLISMGEVNVFETATLEEIIWLQIPPTFTKSVTIAELTNFFRTWISIKVKVYSKPRLFKNQISVFNKEIQ